jgi:hypothetical protein
VFTALNTVERCINHSKLGRGIAGRYEKAAAIRWARGFADGSSVTLTSGSTAAAPPPCSPDLC